jgi:hypothetical protein
MVNTELYPFADFLNSKAIKPEKCYHFYFSNAISVPLNI